ncbi:isochorismatase [Spongiactinospora gelatinilytica]|uniref:Isochorismatase n=1 Tax=Spongiactinospora gelatinilytica TaxID=2666298 RepID=A0A2W2FIF4_9ACTN|nr:isochorismatase family protein [Spongiactinospora gelatinilytica]PZG35441.1 isochorismatase [Spongiactinospora gelatinilytica]
MPGIPPIEPYPLPTAGDLPRSIATWTPDPDRAVLLIHDMQRYFLSPFPGQMRAELIRNIALLRTRAAALGVPVGYTAQPGDMTEEQRGLLKDFWGPGMRRTPEEQAVVDELTPAPGDWMFGKLRYSAFFRSDLLARIRESGRDQLVICGVYAHVGILATAIESYTNDLQTFLAGDAIGDFTAAYHRLTLNYAAERCAVVVTAKEVFP